MLYHIGKKCTLIILALAMVLCLMPGAMRVARAASSWTAVPSFTSDMMADVAYGNGCFIAISFYNGEIYKSIDNGHTWEYKCTPHPNLGYITFGNNTFIVTDNNREYIYYSQDNGETWNEMQIGSIAGGYLNGITYGIHGFVAVGFSESSTSSIFVSENGISTWSNLDGISGTGFQNVGYGNGVYIAVGLNGKIYRSTDTATWTLSESIPNSDYYMAVTYGEGLFVAVSSLGSIIVSDDLGITWSLSYSIGNYEYNEITYGNGCFYAVANGGVIVKSYDGINWSTETSGTASNLWGIGYGNGYFMATGESGVMMFRGPSSDASLTSVLTMTDSSTIGTGTSDDPVAWEISLDNAVPSLSASGIVAADGATMNLYSDPGFSTEVMGADVIPLTEGGITTAYIKVTAEDGIAAKYYAVAIFRAAPPDTIAPTAFDGTITTSGVTQAGATLSWNKATDNVSAQAALQYLVYQSDSNNLNSVVDIEANGTAIGSYAADIATKDVTGLAVATTYYFNVIVKDEAGNKACYTAKQVTTLPTDITSASVTGMVAPAAGGTPVTAGGLISSDNSYTVTGLTWQNGNGSTATLTAGGKFMAGTSYKAEIELTSAVKYKFQTGGFMPAVNAGTPQAGMVSGGDMSGNTLTFTVTFPDTSAKAVNNIEVKTQPGDLSYEDGEALNLTGLVVTLTYNDETMLDVALSDFLSNSITASPADGTEMVYAVHNKQKVLISCGSYTAETNALTVSPPNITTAGITGMSAPVTGSAPITVSSLNSNDLSSYTVTSLIWQNGNGTAATLTSGGKFRENSSYQAEIVLTSATGHKFPASGLTPTVNAGTPQAGTVSDGNVSGNTLTFTVTFPDTGAKAVTGIAVKTQPGDLSYEDGETLNLTGLVVTLTYNDETMLDVALSDFSSNSITAGPADGTEMVYAVHNGQKVLISCGSYTEETNTLTVSPPNITTAGITGMSAPVTGSAPITLSSLNSNDASSYTVTSLTWQNGNGTAATLTSGGKFQENSGYKAEIVLTSAAGHKFPASGLTPSVNAGTPQVGTVSGGNVSGNTLTFTVTFPVTGAKAVNGIAIKTQPGDLSYEDRETLNLSGLEVTLSYSDDSALDVALADFASNGITTSPADGTTMVYATHNGQKVRLSCGEYTAETNALTVSPPDIMAAGITGMTAPVTGSAPIAVSSLNTNDASSYTVTSLTWQNGGGTAATLTGGGKFRENSSYQAEIVLTSAVEHKFPASGLTPSVDAGMPQAGTVSGGNVSGNTLTFTVTFPVTGAKAVTGIAVKTQPGDFAYEDGESLNLLGLVATLTYSDDSALDVALSDFASNGITTNPADGTAMVYATHNGQKVRLSCGEYTAETNALTVSPSDIMAAGITGMTASVTGSAPIAVSSLNSNDAGSYTVKSLTWQNGDGTAATLTSGGKFKANSSYLAEIVLTSTAEHKFPASGLTPSVNMGTPQAGTVSGGNVSGNTLTFTVTFPVTGAKAVTGIAVKTQPGDLSYDDGETLNLSGLVATLTYSDDTALDVEFANFVSSGITASLADGTVLSYELHDRRKVLISCGSYTAETNALTVIPPTPILTAGAVNRTSDQVASVTFISDQAGTYYYDIVADGVGAPGVSTAGQGSVCLTGESTIGLITLTAGDLDLYVKVKSVAGKVSEALKMDIAAYFVPVTGITDLLGLAWVGTGRTLTGTVSPEDATNQTIVWSVKNAGATGAAISGNTFTATGTGTAILTATIDKGTSPTNDYTQDFSIEVHPTMVYNTIEDQADSSTTITAEGVMAQEAQLIVTPIADGDADRVELEEQLSEQNAIAAYEVHVEPAEAFRPPLTLTFQVGQTFNDRTIYILHKLSNGSTDIYTPTVKNGEAVITVNELSPFLLAMDPLVTIIQQPQSVLALINQTATFHVEATGLDPLSYQWQRRTGDGAAWEDISGATGQDYTTTRVNKSHNGYQYRVIVSDILGNSATSDTVALTVMVSPDTGDDSMPLVYTVLTVLFAAAVMLLLRKCRIA